MAEHDRIWAPWRIGYVSGKAPSANQDAQPQPVSWQSGADEDCFLCHGAATYADQAAADRDNFVARRGQRTLVMLNRYPYNNGHLMVAPLRHVAELEKLTDAEQLECMEMLSQMTRVLGNRLQAQGFNVGLNLGVAAGAGLPGHLHWHLVPRWAGDHNFMPVMAGVRVIPQALEELWELLTEA